MTVVFDFDDFPAITSPIDSPLPLTDLYQCDGRAFCLHEDEFHLNDGGNGWRGTGGAVRDGIMITLDRSGRPWDIHSFGWVDTGNGPFEFPPLLPTLTMSYPACP